MPARTIQNRLSLLATFFFLISLTRLLMLFNKSKSPILIIIEHYASTHFRSHTRGIFHVATEPSQLVNNNNCFLWWSSASSNNRGGTLSSTTLPFTYIYDYFFVIFFCSNRKIQFFFSEYGQRTIKEKNHFHACLVLPQWTMKCTAPNDVHSSFTLFVVHAWHATHKFTCSDLNCSCDVCMFGWWWMCTNRSVPICQSLSCPMCPSSNRWIMLCCWRWLHSRWCSIKRNNSIAIWCKFDSIFLFTLFDVGKRKEKRRVGRDYRFLTCKRAKFSFFPLPNISDWIDSASFGIELGALFTMDMVMILRFFRQTMRGMSDEWHHQVSRLISKRCLTRCQLELSCTFSRSGARISFDMVFSSPAVVSTSI